MVSIIYNGALYCNANFVIKKDDKNLLVLNNGTVVIKKEYDSTSQVDSAFNSIKSSISSGLIDLDSILA